MVGVLLLTHYELGKSLATCAEHILARPLSNLRFISVNRHDDPDLVLLQAREQIEVLDGGAGVIVLTDIYGGTPSNIAYRLVDPGRVEAIAGINLPMLVRALSYSGQGLDVVVSKAVTGGLEGVVYMLPSAPTELGNA